MVALDSEYKLFVQPTMAARRQQDYRTGVGLRPFISPRQILAAATLSNAELFGLAADHGTIQPGKRAHLLLLGAAPLRSVTDFDALETVILGDRALARSDLPRRGDRWRGDADLARAIAHRPYRGSMLAGADMTQLRDEDAAGDDAAPRGADLRVDLELTFEDAAEGCRKIIAVTRREPCDACDATGAGRPTDCVECRGTGAVMHRQARGLAPANCPRCTRGKVARKCRSCGGRGASERTRDLEVSIPAGIDDGCVLRLAEKGEPIRGGPPGHLFVVLEVLPHPRFTRRDSDLVVDVVLSRELAARGGRVTVPMLMGERDVDIPARSRSGDEVVVRGCGVQVLGAPPTPMAGATDAPYRELDTSGRGALIVRIQLEQRGLGAWLRRLWRRIA
jgi:DnaJ C terminal domain/Amidohydrolase family